MLDYDASSKLWLVQKVNKQGRVVDVLGKTVVNGGKTADGLRMNLETQYWIPRVRLMFYAENPANFAKRVAKAYRQRKSTESELRYNLYIDCMPMEGVGELDQASLKRMTEWAKGAPALARDKTYVA